MLRCVAGCSRNQLGTCYEGRSIRPHFVPDASSLYSSARRMFERCMHAVFAAAWQNFLGCDIDRAKCTTSEDGQLRQTRGAESVHSYTYACSEPRCHGCGGLPHRELRFELLPPRLRYVEREVAGPRSDINRRSHSSDNFELYGLVNAESLFASFLNVKWISFAPRGSLGP